MESHFQEVLYAIGTMLPIMVFIWQMNKSQMDKIDRRFELMEERFDRRFEAIDRRFELMEERFDKRFDKLDERLARIEQNHIDHMTALHAVPARPPQPLEQASD